MAVGLCAADLRLDVVEGAGDPLVINPSLKAGAAGVFVVTHDRSGRAVCGCGSLDAACRVRLDLMKLGRDSWDRTESTLVGDRRFRARVNRMLRRARREGDVTDARESRTI